MHVIGTAGHVDHGKSTLVQALTGIDPDRLTEEKEREMTIDLGFAWLKLGDDEIGIIDVPGHRDFIENMLAGVGGIDLVLFVIAADEGVMPQTREHLAILDLLAIKRGVVALTKSDLVDDPEWMELVSLEISDLLKGTILTDAPIIPVSARTGAGLDQLKQTIAHLLAEIGQPADWGRPRLSVDRVFSLPGFGTIVTGTLLDGTLRVGDDVEIIPETIATRVRGLQTHKVKRDKAYPGSRVAINLTGVDKDEIRRGQVVAARGMLRGTILLDASYRHLPDAGLPLAHNSDVKLFIGAAEIPAHVRVIGREKIAPGEEGWIQLALAHPTAAVRGDRFILRRPSPSATIGGGVVLDPHPGHRHRRFRSDVVERFATLAKGSPHELLLRLITQKGPIPVVELQDRSGLPAADSRTALEGLLERREIIQVGNLVIAAPAWDALRERIPAEVAGYHRDAPLRAGMDREELRNRLRVPVPLFTHMLKTLVEEGILIEEGTLLRLPDHSVRLTAEQEKAVGQLMSIFADQGILSPSVKECKSLVGEPVYYALVESGRLKPVAEDVVYAADLYATLIQTLTDYVSERGSITAAEARDLLGASRKYAIALLEHLDELRVTRRVGDIRVPARMTAK